MAELQIQLLTLGPFTQILTGRFLYAGTMPLYQKFYSATIYIMEHFPHIK